jgi:hypothetical protein
MLMHRCIIWLVALFMLFTVQAQQSCEQLKKRHFNVSTVQDIAELAAAAACSGKALTATWHGALALSETITVGSTTSLAITAATGNQFSAAATIDGNSTTQLFVVNGNLTLTSMTLQNGLSSTQGGAINAVTSAFVVLQNCTLTGHRAAEGAAIFINSGGTLQIDDSSFSYNAAGVSGSSIYATGATLNIRSSVFINELNSAVYAEASTVAIINSTFSNNMADLGAGLACFKGTIANVSGCLFDSNQARSEAGAILVNTQSQLIASDTLFSSNTAGGGSGAVGTVVGSSAEFTNVSTILECLGPPSKLNSNKALYCVTHLC